MRRYAKLLIAVVLVAIIVIGANRLADQNLANGVRYQQAVVITLHQQQGSPNIATVRVVSGVDAGRTFTASVGVPPGSLDITPPIYQPGARVLVSREAVNGAPPVYVITDYYRLNIAGWLLALVLVLAVLFAGWRGVGSILGLLFSTAVLVGFVIPQILHGHSPYLATAIGIALISSIGIFVAHGFSRRTGLALLATYGTLLLAVGLAALVVGGMHLTGVTDDNIFYLAQARPDLHLQGLLLCGMLISLIGVLDDITVGQATSVEELYKANHSFSIRQAYRSGLKIGREHISSLINTLVLVFIGTSFLFITYLSALSPYNWVVNLNSSIVMQEIARALVGSMTLILAVPITTLLAAHFLKPAVKSRPSRHKASAVSESS